MNFQEYLISKGWKRYKKEYRHGNFTKQYDEVSQFVSSYSPTEYFFEHPEYPNVNLWWGLHIKDRPPVFSLSRISYIPLKRDDKYIVDQDLWFNTLKTFGNETVYNLLLNEGVIYVFDGKLYLEEPEEYKIWYNSFFKVA